jgi:hypothetical protein
LSPAPDIRRNLADFGGEEKIGTNWLVRSIFTAVGEKDFYR